MRRAADMEPWDSGVTLAQLKVHDIWSLRRQFLERLFPVVDTLRVLELGSGPAHDSLVFAERGAYVTAVDCSETGLAIGRRIYRELGLPLETLVRDARATGLPDGQYDIVFNAGVLEHFSNDDLEKVVDEMIRVVRVGGIILAFCPNRYYVYYQHHLRQRHRWNRQYEYERAFTAREMRECFLARGLTAVESSGVHVHPALNYLLPRCVPKHHRIESFCRWCFRWLEKSRLKWLRSVIGQDFVVWARRPANLGCRRALSGLRGGPVVQSREGT